MQNGLLVGCGAGCHLVLVISRLAAAGRRCTGVHGPGVALTGILSLTQMQLPKCLTFQPQVSTFVKADIASRAEELHFNSDQVGKLANLNDMSFNLTCLPQAHSPPI